MREILFSGVIWQLGLTCVKVKRNTDFHGFTDERGFFLGEMKNGGGC